MELDGDIEQEVEPEALGIQGIYVDDYDSKHNIGDEQWKMIMFGSPSVFHYSQFSNTNRFVIAQNDDANDYNAGKWSRFDWTWTSGDTQLWFCQTAYAAESEADALATAAADDTNPASSGCGGFAWSRLDKPAISSIYVDDYDSKHNIGDEQWKMIMFGSPSVFHYSQFSNTNRFVIAQNDDANDYNAGKWSRFDWTWTSGDTQLWFCQTAYAAESEADALATAAADDTNPASSGCGGFAWSRLDTLAIIGSYVDDYNSDHTIGANEWAMVMFGSPSAFHYSQFSNTDQFIIAQNDDANDYNAGKWSRFDWTWTGGDTQLWFCQTAYAAESEADALGTTAADDSDPANTGCGGFAWSQLNTTK